MKKVEKEFVPSKYQQDIFDFVEHGVGNLVVEAVAGSGKTTLLIECLKRIDPSKHVLFVSFNRSIVNDIKKKIKGFDNVEAHTVHSFGLQALIKNGYKFETNEKKYTDFIYKHIKELTPINTYALGKKRSLYLDNIKELVNFMRDNLLSTPRDAVKISHKHGIELIADEDQVAPTILEWGKHNTSELDFGDMVWIPNISPVQIYGNYDFILVDECQDISTAQRELLLKAGNKGTRYIFVGDSSQSIYGFASADIESFEKIRNLPNMTSLPLSVTYRCAENIVHLAKKSVSQIECCGDGRLGEVKYDCDLSEVKDGSMVLCRNNAPLFAIYVDLLKDGKACRLNDSLSITALKNEVSKYKDMPLGQSLKHKGLFSELYKDLFDLRSTLASKYGITQAAAAETEVFEKALDKIKSLEALSDGLEATKELIERIEHISSRSSKDAILLSTIHKAKGLESDTVFIACRSLMPSKSAKLDWQLQQEKNLEYVAITRAKNFLGFLKEEKFQDYLRKGDSLKKIEEKIDALYSKHKKAENISSFAYFRQPKKEPVEVLVKKGAYADMKEISKAKTPSLSSITQTLKSKKKKKI